VVTGGVADVRPYLFEALAVVAPLRIARGIQNKVLEALAMGKPVLASSQVAATFGTVPYGVVACETAAEYTDALRSAAENWPFDAAIRDAARRRFTWSSNLNTLTEAVDDALVSARL
jgi:glycosyltransferase involved in cell wall biosynthesis